MANNGDVKIGKVVQIIGPVVDVEFEDYLPPIHQALRITSEGFEVDQPVDVVSEVQQHLGEGRVRAPASRRRRPAETRLVSTEMGTETTSAPATGSSQRRNAGSSR